MAGYFAPGEFVEGLVQAIREMRPPQHHFPYQKDDVNELPDDPVFHNESPLMKQIIYQVSCIVGFLPCHGGGSGTGYPTSAGPHRDWSMTSPGSCHLPNKQIWRQNWFAWTTIQRPRRSPL